MFANIVLLCGTFLPIHAQQYRENSQYGQGFDQNNGLRLQYFSPTANQVRYQSNFPIERLDPNLQTIFVQHQQVEIDSITSEKLRPRLDRDLRDLFVENGKRNPYPGQVSQFPFPPWDRRSLFFSSPVPERAEENLNTGRGSDIQGYKFITPYSPHPEQIQRSSFPPRPMETPFSNNQIPSKSQPNLSSGVMEQTNPVATFWFILPLLKQNSSLEEPQIPNKNQPVFPESKKEMEEHLHTHEERMKTFLGLMSKISENLPKNQMDNYPLSEEKGANFDQERRIDQTIRLLKFFRCLIQMKKDVEGDEQSENSSFQAINEPKLEEKPLFLVPKIDSNTIRFGESPKPIGRPKDHLVAEYHMQKLEDQAKTLHKLHHLYHQKKVEDIRMSTQKPQILFQKKDGSSQEVFDDFQAKLHDLYQRKRLDSSDMPKEKDDYVDELAEIYQEEKMKAPKNWPNFKAEKSSFELLKIPVEPNVDNSDAKQIPKDHQGAPILSLEINSRNPKKIFDQKFDDFQKKTIKEHLGAPILKLEILPRSTEPQKSMESKVGQVSRLDKLFQDQKEEKYREFYARIEELSKEEDNVPLLREIGVQSEQKEERNSVPNLEVLPLNKPEDTKVKFIGKSQSSTPEKENTASVFKSPPRYASNFEAVPTLPTEKSVEMNEPKNNNTLHPTPKNRDLQEEQSRTSPEKLITKLVALEGKLKQINKNPLAENIGDALKKTEPQKEKIGEVMNLLQGSEDYQKHQQHLEGKEGMPKKDKLGLEEIQESVEEKIIKNADQYKKQKLDEIYGPLASKLVVPGEETPKPADKIREKENRPNLEIIRLEKDEIKPNSNQFWKDTSGLALKTKFQEDQSSLEKKKEGMPTVATKVEPTLIETPKGSFLTKDNHIKEPLHLLGDKGVSSAEDISKKVASQLAEENRDRSFPGNKREDSSPGVYENKVLERTVNELSEKNSTTTPKSDEEWLNKGFSSWNKIKKSSSSQKNKVPESSEPQSISTSTPIPSSTTDKGPTTKDPFLSALKIKYLPAKKSNFDYVSFEDDNEEEELSTKSPVLTSESGHQE